MPQDIALLTMEYIDFSGDCIYTYTALPRIRYTCSWVVGVGVLPDHRHAVVYSEGQLYMHDFVTDPIIVQTPLCHIRSCTVLSDGRIACESDSAIWLLNVSSNTVTLLAHLDAHIMATFTTPDGIYVAVKTFSDIYVYHVNGTLVYHRQDSADPHSFIALPDSRLVTCKNNGNIIMRDINKRQALTFRAHTARIIALAYDPVVGLVSSSLDGTTRIWNLNTGETRTCHHMGSNIVVLAPVHIILFYNTHIKLWNIATDTVYDIRSNVNVSFMNVIDVNAGVKVVTTSARGNITVYV